MSKFVIQPHFRLQERVAEEKGYFAAEGLDFDCSTRSPCVRNCCLDDDLTCLGCFRSLDEIKEWGIADDHRRRIILKNAQQRREADQG
jgi:predicted Fe-S protein YdhL (DUF1289 family)